MRSRGAPAVIAALVLPLGLLTASAKCASAAGIALRLAPRNVVATTARTETADESTSVVSVSSQGVPADNRRNAYAVFAQSSADGSIVVFYSSDYSLDPSVAAPKNPAYATGGLFVRNTVTGVTRRLERFAGDNGPTDESAFQLSGDGHWVAYIEVVSSAPAPGSPYPYHREAYLQNVDTGQRVRISSPVPDTAQYSDIYSVALSDDGSTAIFEGFSGQADDWHNSVWLFDRRTGMLRDVLPPSETAGPDTSCAGPNYGGGQPVISGDGSTIAMTADFSSDQVDPHSAGCGSGVYLLSTRPGALPRKVPTASGADPDNSTWFGARALSYDGSLLEFASQATNWTDPPQPRTYVGGYVYIVDTKTDALEEISKTTDGYPVWADPDGLSSDGRYAIFETPVSGVVPHDGNDQRDIFLADLQTNTVSRIDTGPDGEELDAGAEHAQLAADGQHLTFVSTAKHVVYGTDNNGTEVFETTLAGGSAANLEARPTSHAVSLTWSNPRANFRKVVVRASRAKSAPNCRTCGRAVYRGRANHAVFRRLHNGKLYRFAVFTINRHDNAISRKVAATRPHINRYHRR
ncbi:MAG TPA: hypothetical protein VG650_01440 [Mycobacteriales bacterium]|nr:hypothetical protein [Mycobacteriales bacterium]